MNISILRAIIEYFLKPSNIFTGNLSNISFKKLFPKITNLEILRSYI